MMRSITSSHQPMERTKANDVVLISPKGHPKFRIQHLDI